MKKETALLNFPYNEVQKKLKKLRTERRLSLRQLSEDVTISIPTLNGAEYKENITLETLYKLLAYYCFHPKDFWNEIYSKKE